jgi:tripartite ATP-independent transporter DctP family solute receptor
MKTGGLIMKLRLSISILSLLLCALASIFFANSVFAKTYQLGHVFATSNANHKGAEKWAELAEKYTDGQVKIQVFPAGQLGGDRELGAALEKGTMGFAVLNPGAATNDLRVGIDALTFLVDSYEMVDKWILGGWVGEQMNKASLDHGWRVLARGENDFRQLTNSKRPVKKVEDIEGLKLRVPQSPPMINFWEGMGAIPTPIAFPELYTALQQQTVDGQENGILLTYSSRLFEPQKYCTIINYMYSSTAFTVAESLWKSFDKETQEALRKAAGEAAAYQVKENRADVAAARKAMEDAGIEFFKMPAEEREKMQKVSIETSWSLFQEKVDPEVYDKLVEIRKLQN